MERREFSKKRIRGDWGCLLGGLWSLEGTLGTSGKTTSTQLKAWRPRGVMDSQGQAQLAVTS